MSLLPGNCPGAGPRELSRGTLVTVTDCARVSVLCLRLCLNHDVAYNIANPDAHFIDFLIRADHGVVVRRAEAEDYIVSLNGTQELLEVIGVEVNLTVSILLREIDRDVSRTDFMIAVLRVDTQAVVLKSQVDVVKALVGEQSNTLYIGL